MVYEDLEGRKCNYYTENLRQNPDTYAFVDLQ